MKYALPLLSSEVQQINWNVQVQYLRPRLARSGAVDAGVSHKFVFDTFISSLCVGKTHEMHTTRKLNAFNRIDAPSVGETGRIRNRQFCTYL